MSHLPEERTLTQHFLGALLTTTSVWTGTFLSSPGLGRTTRTLTGLGLWEGDKNPDASPSGRVNKHTELISSKAPSDLGSRTQVPLGLM